MNEQALQRIEAPTMTLDAVGRKAAIDELLNKVALVMETMKSTMRDGEHFGVIPGCGTKPALLKAGAEKLGMVFRIKPSFDVQERDLGRQHREYYVKCSLSDGTQGVGSCNTMENKYRYRQGERKCPECGKATIIVGKKEYGGGFLCFAKKGGCGAKFTDSDERITGQQVGKVEHDNPPDFYNTCLKMAKKRAHVDAIITATACSDIFTQDVEEIVQAADATVTTITTPPAPAEAPQAKSEPRKANPEPKQSAVDAEQVLRGVTVEMITEKKGTNSKTGKPWTAYFMLFSDGTTNLEAATFSKTFATMAQTISDQKGKAEITVKPGNQPGRLELVNILPAPDEDNVSFEFDDKGQPIGNTP